MSFEQAVRVILAHEGGYVDHPSDPGGATNMGITHKTLAAWRRKEVTKEDVRNLTVGEAKDIYRANYWQVRGIDDLPPGLALSVFDFSVNAGPTKSVKTLQAVLGVERDGQIGLTTLKFVRDQGERSVIDAFAAARMDHYRSLRHWDTFKGGWTRRTEDVRKKSHELAVGAVSITGPATIPSAGLAGLIARLITFIATGKWRAQ